MPTPPDLSLHGRANLPQPCPSPACGQTGALHLVWYPDTAVHGSAYSLAVPGPRDVVFDLANVAAHRVEIAAIISCGHCGVRVRGRLVDFEPYGAVLDSNPPTHLIRSGRFVQWGTRA